MHNNLNSVIIEGTVLGITKYDDKCHFTMGIRRHYRKDGEVLCDTVYINVFVDGKLCEVMSDKLDIDRTVRVVGRLINVQYVGNNCGSVEIYAEHIELKPDGKEEEDAKEET